MLKSATFTMRIKPEIKAALMELARRESRTAAGQLEALVLEKCKSIGVEVPAASRKKVAK